MRTPGFVGCVVVVALLAGPAAAKLNIHLVPHSHDDVGWLKTVDQYYIGSNNSIQHAGVQYILDTMLYSLEQNPERTFVYVEQAFFQRWWRQQDAATQARVRKVIAAGQLEFVSGAWCMHDEAATHYIGLIDQTTLGHRYLKEQFDIVPTIGWQIDPFGHSSTQPSLLSAEVGYDALFFGRIDYQDREERMRTKNMEFVWNASPSLGDSARIFTGSFLSGNYGPPSGFCYDVLCSDDPVQDDPRLEDMNVKYLVDLFVKRCEEHAKSTQGDDIMFQMGSDFHFENAHMWFKNMDKLIRYVNADGRVNVFYSTPARYVKAKLAAGIPLSVKTDDFFPYADGPESWWSGYYTSRPSLKRNTMVQSGYLNAAWQWEALHKLELGSLTDVLEEAVAVLQHHDGVSGTSKQHVAYDYAKRLAKGYNKAAAGINALIGPGVTQCPLLNESVCAATQASPKGFRVTLYNPIARNRERETVTLPVSSPNLVVLDAQQQLIPSQVLPAPQSAGKGSPPYSLSFLASAPSLAASTFYIKPAAAVEAAGAAIASRTRPAADTEVLENEVLRLTFVNGTLRSIGNKRNGMQRSVAQHYFWYESAVQKDHQNSGAYIFRPSPASPGPRLVTSTPEAVVIRGGLVQEVRQTFAPWLKQTIRLTKGQPYAEIEWTVGPVPIGDGLGKEVMSRFDTDIDTQGYLYTDSNGREMVERRRNYRPTYKINVTEFAASNYYPIVSAAFVKERTGRAQLTLLTDRAQGVASLADGSLEVMVHRRTLADDARGVGEAMNETESCTPYPDFKRIGEGLVASGRHYLLLDDAASAAATWRPLAYRIFAQPILAFNPLTGDSAVKSERELRAAAVGSLPPNVDLITLQVASTSAERAFLIRLAHQFAVGEDAALSKHAQVSLARLFPDFAIRSVTEMSLTANQERDKMNPIPPMNVPGRPEWSKPTMRPSSPARGGDFTVVLGPMEVRTYRIVIA